MSRFVDELRHAFRALIASPTFSLASVLTLTIGIGAIAAIFTVYDAVLLKPLPFAHADRLVRVTRTQAPVETGTLSLPIFSEWRDRSAAAFDAIGGYYAETRNLVGNGDAQHVTTYMVTPGFWNVFSQPLALGRAFGDDEENRGERVVVLSDGLWRDRFGAAADVIGRNVDLSGESFRVVGVAKAGFRYPADAQIWIPTFIPASAYRDKRDSHFLRAVARIRSDASPAQAAAVMKTITDDEARRFPDTETGLASGIKPLQAIIAADLSQPLRMLLIAAALVLLIACANLANLMLARGQVRTQELALRRALGASHGRLVREVLAEALLIAVAGVVAGLAIARPAIAGLVALAPDLLPIYNVPTIDLRVIGATTAIAIATLLVFGLVPAWRAAAIDPVQAMQGASRGQTGTRSHVRVRAFLVSAEVALAMTLLAGASLLIESLRHVAEVDSGVASASVLTAQFSISTPVAQADEALDAWAARTMGTLGPRLDAIEAKLRELPGVEEVALSDRLPASGDWGWNGQFQVVGRPHEDKASVEFRFVSPGYFRAFGIPLKQGRALEVADGTHSLYPTELLVNEAFAARYLGDDPLGREVDTFGAPAPMRVVGVVGNVHQAGLDRPANIEVYFPIVKAVKGDLIVALKVQGDAMNYAEPLRRAMREVAPDAPVYSLRTMDEVTGETLRLRRFNMTLMSVFAAIAVVLAAIGLYGVIAYAVGRRRREIGLRQAIGATTRDVQRLMLGSGLRMIVPGLVFGLVGALALGRVIASQLYGVGASDPIALASVALVLALVSIAACAVPILRAVRVPPMEALRDE